MTLLEIRKKYELTQSSAADALNIPIRTYIRYEENNNYGSELKRNMMLATLQKKYEKT